MSEPRYLCIGKSGGSKDHFRPDRALIGVCRRHGFGTLKTLPEDEVSLYAEWCAIHGGRDLLDAFELAAINDGVVKLEPEIESLDGLEGDIEWTALEMTHGPDRIRWRPKVMCDECDGTGEPSAWQMLTDEDNDECEECCGDGYFYGGEVVTDYEGNVMWDEA
jgi:hypothetical protein